MSADATVTRTKVSARFDELGLRATPVEIEQLSDYFCLLAKWNSRINLTALPVASAATSAIDRLLAEPFAASKLLRESDDLAVDLGSGGGSPAFPLKIGAPQLRMVLVESKARKCAFLREVARSLALSSVEVANARFEVLNSRPDLAGRVDLVSLRAVRADSTLWAVVSALLKPGGWALWFGGPDYGDGQGGPTLGLGLTFATSQVLFPATRQSGASRLAVVQKAS